MRSSLLCSAALALAAAPAFATPYVLNADARPVARDGRVATDAYNDTTFAFDADVRHFGYQLGRSAGNPYFTADPGFNALAGSGLPAGQQLRFDVVRRLSRWDGQGVVRFLAPTNDARLRFQFGAASAIVTGGTGAVAGIPMGNVAGGGSIHRHVNAYLEAGPTQADAPAAGLYFTALRLSVSGGSLARSDALYVAYNNGLPDADFRRGMAYLADPTPGDANFDARVDFDDLLTLAQNYGSAGEASWFDGDFTRDRAVNFDDLLALAQRYGATGAITADAFDSTFASDWALAQAMVPEPSTLVIAAVGFLPRNRRVPRMSTLIRADPAAAPGTDEGTHPWHPGCPLAPSQS